MNSKIMFLWGMIILLMCASLILIANYGKDRVLSNLEREIKAASSKYFKDNDLVPKFNEVNIVYVDELIEKEYLEYNTTIDEYCVKSVQIKNKLIFNEYEVIRECDEVLKST